MGDNEGFRSSAPDEAPSEALTPVRDAGCGNSSRRLMYNSRPRVLFNELLAVSGNTSCMYTCMWG